MKCCVKQKPQATLKWVEFNLMASSKNNNFHSNEKNNHQKFTADRVAHRVGIIVCSVACLPLQGPSIKLFPFTV